jgi:hypothetical protein
VLPVPLVTASSEHVPAEALRYGRGFWLHATGPGIMLERYEAGRSFRTVRDPESDTTYTVIANWSHGAWPVTGVLDRDLLGWRLAARDPAKTVTALTGLSDPELRALALDWS